MALRRPLGAALLLCLALASLWIHSGDPNKVTFAARRVLADKSDLGMKSYKHHVRQHHHHHRHHQRSPLVDGNEMKLIPSSSGQVDDGDEIDPRYGVEKRLVPSGPNPLHH